MEVEHNRLYFYKTRREGSGTIEHDLMTLKVLSIDSKDKKVFCKSRRHYGVSIVGQSGHRKLYFLSFSNLEMGIEYLLKAQNFKQRID